MMSAISEVNLCATDVVRVYLKHGDIKRWRRQHWWFSVSGYDLQQQFKNYQLMYDGVLECLLVIQHFIFTNYNLKENKHKRDEGIIEVEEHTAR